MSERRQERGVTILIVAAAMIAMLAMLALAVDIVSLYASEGDAQRAADAAALAGAKVFVSSGFTSGQLGDPTSGTAQDQVCNGSTGLADLQAQALAAPNLIAGAAATSVTTSCTFPANNPQITVTVQRTGLPSFFARMWGSRIISVSRSAKAEAYNSSGQSVPIQVHSVKPWLIPNGNFYFDSNYNIITSNLFIGQTTFTFSLLDPTKAPTPPTPTTHIQNFYAIAIPISPPTPICPSTSAVSCNNLGTGGSTRKDYEENIACSGMYSVNSTDQIGPSSPITMIDPVKGQIKSGQATLNATNCLIHADAGSVASGSGQDTINPSAVGTPVTISGGYNNPNPALQNAPSISRSDSVVMVPVYDDKGGTLVPCSGSPPVCNQQLQIIGFLQLGIQYVDGSGNVYAVILNAAGSNPANSGTTPLPAGWLDSVGFRHVNEAAPVPVRLIQ